VVGRFSLVDVLVRNTPDLSPLYGTTVVKKVGALFWFSTSVL
jgi:hypothetical protein